MIISEKQIKQSIKYLRTTQPKKTEGISLRAQKYDISLIREEINKLPPTRNPRLGVIKESLAQRRYSISSHQVAEKIIGRALSDKIR